MQPTEFAALLGFYCLRGVFCKDSVISKGGKPIPKLTQHPGPGEQQDSGGFEINLFFLLEKQVLGWPKTSIQSVCF